MGEWVKKTLDEILVQRKRQIEINPNTKYSLVTISNKGIIKLREVKNGSDIKDKKGYIAKAGDFIYSRLAVHTGAFGIVPIELDNALITNEMPCFEIDKTKILPEILIKMIGMENFIWQLKSLTKGVGRVRIKESMILSLSLIFPNIQEQQKIVKYFKSIEAEERELKTELTHQQTLLKKLRQQILQEAIEGKLTADWREQNPDVEPAGKLLERIEEEKAQLIKDKKIKAQKPLSPISETEKPFALPKGWVWCRIGNITSISSGRGFTKSEYTKSGVRLFQIANVSFEKVSWDIKVYVPTEYLEEYPSLELKVGDIIMALNRPLLGKRLKVACLTESDVPSILYQRVGRFDLYSNLLRRWLYTYIKSQEFSEWLYNQIKGVNIPFVNQTKVYTHLMPIPPLAEQKAIVTKVEKLLATCEQLENQVKANQVRAKELMQAVLKEAFTQSDKTDKPPAKKRSSKKR